MKKQNRYSSRAAKGGKKQKPTGMGRIRDAARRIVDDARQLGHPREFRIAAMNVASSLETARVEPHVTADSGEAGWQGSANDRVFNELVAEFATCLWYVKTKHFKRQWEDAETDDGDPRVRRTLGRINKSAETLKEFGIEIDDPINKRYAQGSEGTMRPLDFLPTVGLTFEMVSETVVPIIYRDGTLLQRGQVFVAVPKEDTAEAASATLTPSACVSQPDALPPNAQGSMSQPTPEVKPERGDIVDAGRDDTTETRGGKI